MRRTREETHCSCFSPQRTLSLTQVTVLYLLIFGPYQSGPVSLLIYLIFIPIFLDPSCPDKEGEKKRLSRKLNMGIIASADL